MMAQSRLIVVCLDHLGNYPVKIGEETFRLYVRSSIIDLLIGKQVPVQARGTFSDHIPCRSPLNVRESNVNINFNKDKKHAVLCRTRWGRVRLAFPFRPFPPTPVSSTLFIPHIFNRIDPLGGPSFAISLILEP
jgi:hypothetical protein